MFFKNAGHTETFKNIKTLIDGNMVRNNETVNQFFLMTCKYLLSH